MILPALTLALVLFGEYTLIVRSAMLETLGEDYVLTARAKGLTQRTIVRKHALRNSLLPITTLIALSLGFIVAGAILVEAVFSCPGIGLRGLPGGLQRDYPMLQGAFLILTLSVVFANLIADLLYFRLDPRITRMSDRRATRPAEGSRSRRAAVRAPAQARSCQVLREQPSALVGLASSSGSSS